jgi:deoxyxylulose-5-phosphate synthase
MLGKFMEESLAAPWRLTKKGHYVSVINPAFISLFTEKMFYEGEVIDEGNDGFTPDNLGVLVTEEGIYKGGFSKGKAHGSGTFIEAASKTTFKGEWRDGVFLHGTI